MEVIFVVATSLSLMSFFRKQFQVLTPNVQCIFESCIEIKGFMKAFKASFEAPQRSVKIKI